MPEDWRSEFNPLKLENQYWFSLNASAKEVVCLNKPLPWEIDLTYARYIAMRVLWRAGTPSVKALRRRLFLVADGAVRCRDAWDERSTILSITPENSVL